MFKKFPAALERLPVLGYNCIIEIMYFQEDDHGLA